MEFGLDHASHQERIDMARLAREGHTFEIGKCSGEGNYVNPYYAENHRRAVEAGMVTGSYDWVEPQDPREPEWLAADYLRSVEALGGRPRGHLLTVDFETPEWFTGPRGWSIEDFMRRYLYTLKDLAKQPVGVYTAPYFLLETGAVRWDWLGRDFWYWLAAPGAAKPDNQLADDSWWHDSLGPPWREMTIHQHQWFARSGAIGSGAYFDRDRFNGTRGQLVALGFGGGKTPEKPQEGEVQEPPAGKFTAYTNANGEPIFVWNAGGRTPRIDGINVVDLGMSVESATEPGVILDVTVRDNVQLPYSDRRQALKRAIAGIE